MIFFQCFGSILIFHLNFHRTTQLKLCFITFMFYLGISCQVIERVKIKTHNAYAHTFNLCDYVVI